MTNIFFIFFLIIVFVFCPFSSVEAYVDPGSGSFLLQLLLATVLGTLYSLKLCWRRVQDFFRTRLSCCSSSTEVKEKEKEKEKGLESSANE